MQESEVAGGDTGRASGITTRGHRDHGLDTPMDAALTFAWACDIADPVVLSRMITFDADVQATVREVMDDLPESIRTQYPTPEALYGVLLAAACLETPPPSADLMKEHMETVELASGRYASRPKGSGRNVHEYQRVSREWKYVVPYEAVRGLPSLLDGDALERLNARASKG